MSERSGVEIDYCLKCRGVWLDRGELDKIIDKADQASRVSGRDSRIEQSRPDSTPNRDDRARRYDDDDDDDDRPPQNRRRRGSILGEIFDF